MEFFTIYNITEILATITALLYVYFIAQEKIIAWFLAFFSSGLLVFSNVLTNLYFFAFLNSLYVALAVYGFYVWRFKTNFNNKIIITEYSLKKHAILILVSIIISAVAVVLVKALNISSTYLEITITVFSVLATYLQANKILSSWLYFMVLNLLSVIVYFNVELYKLAFLFLIYVILSIVGYNKWRNSNDYKQHTTKQTNT